ncbi:YraN family protein [Actinomyces vulturis]|uniref:YraN family protein n=1 Tax=Actinomyces vulturis TaxID=1857645 RepID=UPI000831C247|nr:YraN family protein [Actinomyces vulturis]
MAHHSAIERGRAGENVAARYLTALGWTILDRNWRSSDKGLRGELDIIAQDPTYSGGLIFCEVKTRTTSRSGHGSEAVTSKKYASLTALASSWLREHPDHHRGVRLDVISIHAGQGRHVRLFHHRGVSRP